MLVSPVRPVEDSERRNFTFSLRAWLEHENYCCFQAVSMESSWLVRRLDLLVARVSPSFPKPFLVSVGEICLAGIISHRRCLLVQLVPLYDLGLSSRFLLQRIDHV